MKVLSQLKNDAVTEIAQGPLADPNTQKDSYGIPRSLIGKYCYYFYFSFIHLFICSIFFIF